MKVNIKGFQYDFISDFDPIDLESNIKRNWMVRTGDYFKFPVVIGNTRCFVKRFDKKENDISGYQLLQKIKGVEIQGLPFIYDVVISREKSKSIVYLFTELLDGDTLEDLQRKGFIFAPTKLVGDLYFALRNIHNYGFWFPDFDPKNFFRSEAGNYYVIDLDSSYSLEILPTHSLYGSKDYWAPIFNVYKDYLNIAPLNLKKMRGDVFNLLNLFYLIGLYSYYINDNGQDLTAVSINQLNKYLVNLHPSFLTILKYCFTVNEKTGSILQRPVGFEVFKSFVQTYFFSDNNDQKLSTVAQFPVIRSLTVNGQNVDRIEVLEGSKIEIRWLTENVTKILMHPIVRVLQPNGRITLHPSDDISYIIEALNEHKRGTISIKRGIQITTRILKPSLSCLVRDNNKIKGSDIFKGDYYSLNWTSINATEVWIDNIKVEVAGIKSFQATHNQTHVVRAVNQKNGKVDVVEKQINITVYKLPIINEFIITPMVVKSGGSLEIKWEVSDADGVRIIYNGVVMEDNVLSLGSTQLKLTVVNKDLKKEMHYIELQAYCYPDKVVSSGSKSVTVRKIEWYERFLTRHISIIIALILGLATMILILYNWKIKGKDDKDKEVIVILDTVPKPPPKKEDSIRRSKYIVWKKWLNNPDSFNGKIDQLALDSLPRYITAIKKNRLFIKLYMESPDSSLKDKNRLNELINLDWNDINYIDMALRNSTFKESLLNSLK